MKLKKYRSLFDFLLLAGFFAAAGYGAYIYWLKSKPEPEKSATLTLQDDPGGINIKDMLELARTTPPAPTNPKWEPDVLSNRWKNIVIHHSATLSGNAAIFDRAHHERGMNNGLAYHFVIDNGHGAKDGLVEVSPRWVKQLDGGHLRGDESNYDSIGICLVGDFTKLPPTKKQVASLKALLLKIMQITNLKTADINCHKKMPGQATACPGLLPVEAISKNLNPQTPQAE